ncbi:hypothetical protein RND81_02G234400 [Saponaria officinalis]|uniref:Trichome birefringence-like N-terminal domain-containing protein n=1 Tax=Saponaria officinalis TaxID=3572 RepID=A0AAW1MTM6_SAPOF
MSVTKPWKTQNTQSHFFNKNSWKSMVFYAMLSLILLLCYFSPISTFTTFDHQLSNFSSISIISSNTSSTQENSNNEDAIAQSEKTNEILSTIQNPEISTEQTCDYTNGEWIHDNRGPLYNGSSCKTIKDGQNCMTHLRPDTNYLYWRWQPNQCNISRFNPESFLKILEGKHIAFVGDSLARNQLESLLCMLSSYSDPNLVYSNGDDNKFRRWVFPSQNVTVSVYWSPFLVKGVEKSKNRDYNRLFLDLIDEKWAADLDSIDVAVLSIGHWYLLKSIFIDGGKEIGCHGFDGSNCTAIGFYDPFHKAINTSLRTIIQRNGVNGKKIDVIVTTFPPAHFEGEWDNLDACSKTMPYKKDEKIVEGVNDNLRRIAVEEVEKARIMLNADNVRVTTLDVTRLALLRPDGHPGPYMYYNPFKDGVKERVHNDCVHWCLPGPIDTWNEIMLDIIKRRHGLLDS